MGFFDKIKDIIVNVSEEDGIEESANDVDVYSSANSYGRSSARERQDSSYHFIRERDSSSRSESRRSNVNSGGKVVDIHATAKLQVVLRSPEAYSEAKDVADELAEKRTVVLNLDRMNRDEAYRMITFLSGVSYANDGNIKRIAANTFIITPYSVDVSGDLIDELESNGVYFG